MKVAQTLSAFAIYSRNQAKSTATKSSSKSSPNRKIKLNKNLRSNYVKTRDKSRALNSKKLGSYIEEGDARFNMKSQSVRSDALGEKTCLPHKSLKLNSIVLKNKANLLPNKRHRRGKPKKRVNESTNVREGNKKKNLLGHKNGGTVSSNIPSAPRSSIDTYYDPSPSAQDPIMKGYQLFEWMIAPKTPMNFFETYWEKEPLLVARNNKQYFTHLLTSRQLDQIFRENNLYYSRNVDVVCYENEEKQVFNQEGKANPSALWDYYSNGCSIRILNPQTYNKKVHLLVSTLQEYFGSMVGVNVYLTPPGSQGFAPHFDDIEAFVIQLEGRKHWKLYHPNEEDVLARHSSKNFKHAEIGDPFLEVSLEAGSLLYFPRGVIHEGSTDEDSHSLHLTVSLYQNNAYVDLLEKALPNALVKASKSDIDFRKGLPLHFLRSEDAKQIIVEKVSALVDKLKDFLDVDIGINELGRKLVYDSMPPILTAGENACSSKQDGDLLDNGVVYNKVEFDLATKIRLTRYHCIQLIHEEETKPKLYYSTENAKVYHGEEEQWLDLEYSFVPAIEALQKAYPFYIGIGSLPIESVELKIQFIYDLWERGIIITKEPLVASGSTEEPCEISDSDSE